MAYSYNAELLQPCKRPMSRFKPAPQSGEPSLATHPESNTEMPASERQPFLDRDHSAADSFSDRLWRGEGCTSAATAAVPEHQQRHRPARPLQRPSPG